MEWRFSVHSQVRLILKKLFAFMRILMAMLGPRMSYNIYKMPSSSKRILYNHSN